MRMVFSLSDNRFPRGGRIVNVKTYQQVARPPMTLVALTAAAVDTVICRNVYPKNRILILDK
jgi:hypothetical protein